MLDKAALDKLYYLIGEQIIDLERQTTRRRYSDEYKEFLQRRLDELSELHDKIYEAWKEVADDY